MRTARLLTVTTAFILLLTAIVIIYSVTLLQPIEEMKLDELIIDGLVVIAAFATVLVAANQSLMKRIAVFLLSGATLFYFGSLQDFLDEILAATTFLEVCEEIVTFLGLFLLCLGLIRFLRHQQKLFNEVEAANIRLAEISITDALTGMYNSRHFYERLAGEITRANRYHRTFSILLLDIDNFKHHNDEYGHVSGDRVLKQLGNTIKDVLREQDSGYRYGGEEFTVLLPETDLNQAVVVAERLRKRVADEPFDPGVSKTISIGVSEYAREEDASTLVKRADDAMYRAKRAGKNKVETPDRPDH